MSEWIWYAWFAVFIVFEALGLWKKDDRWRPLTQVTRKRVPWIVVVPFLGWLLWHAIETYLGPVAY